MDFTTIFEAVIAIIIAIVARFLVPYIKSKTTAEQQESITSWINVAVAAAEQIFGSGMGDAKLAYVQDFLSNLGIEVTTAEIESSVYWLTGTITEGLSDESA